MMKITEPRVVIDGAIPRTTRERVAVILETADEAMDGDAELLKRRAILIGEMLTTTDEQTLCELEDEAIWLLAECLADDLVVVREAGDVLIVHEEEW